MPQTVLNLTLAHHGRYDFGRFRKKDVEAALNKDRADFLDLATLLSPAALDMLEPIARKAVGITRRYFGNSVHLFTPLYIANYCLNGCLYCGFHRDNTLRRARLSPEEIEREMQSIAATGLQELLLLTGESRVHSSPEYLYEALEIGKNYFSTLSLEVYPLETTEYALLRKGGADYVSLYQETYNRETYRQMHPFGPKRDFDYRFKGPERALEGGMRGISLGALLGLDDYRNDALLTAAHAYYLQRKYPQAEISFSVPRLRPFANGSFSSHSVSETELLQVMLAYRLFMPHAGLTLSTRERAHFRNHALGLAATRLSAGVKTSVGGHSENSRGDEQFSISDGRTVTELESHLKQAGFQPVYRDYIRV